MYFLCPCRSPDWTIDFDRSWDTKRFIASMYDHRRKIWLKSLIKLTAFSSYSCNFHPYLRRNLLFLCSLLLFLSHFGASAIVIYELVKNYRKSWMLIIVILDALTSSSSCRFFFAALEPDRSPYGFPNVGVNAFHEHLETFFSFNRNGASASHKAPFEFCSTDRFLWKFILSCFLMVFTCNYMI